MTKTSVLTVEMSGDGGVTWNRLGKTIRGLSDTQLKNSVTLSSRRIPQSSAPIRIRFRYYRDGGSIYTHEAAPESPTGIFIDEIITKNCDWLSLRKTLPLSSIDDQFEFSAQTAGTSLISGNQWQLRMQNQLGGKWFPYGPAKSVNITVP